MLVKYNQNGKIKGTVTGSYDKEKEYGNFIEVDKNKTTKNKKVDIESKELVWSDTLTSAKQDKVQEIKQRANEILGETDWYITRNQETGEAIPQDVLDHRSAVRSKSDTFEKEVNNLETVEDVLSYEFSYPDPPEP